jgi:redox-sensitive bicupin YhaK (pirin superfamily)
VSVSFRPGAKEGVRFLFVSSEPLEKPAAWREPILVNIQEELTKVLKEFVAGTLIKTGKTVEHSGCWGRS